MIGRVEKKFYCQAGIIGNLLTLWVLSFGEDENRRKNSFNRLLVKSITFLTNHRLFFIKLKVKA
jgi:hypothetical protein